MSVFTPSPNPISPPGCRTTPSGGSKLQGISAGVQNSNFFVTTSLGRYVLTLFETMPRAELPFYLHLMAHLARHGLPVPAPVANRDNEYLGTLSGKPATLVSRLAGRSEMTPSVGHCARIGAMMAGLHLAGMSFGRRQPNPRGPSGGATAPPGCAPTCPRPAGRARRRARLPGRRRPQGAAPGRDPRRHVPRQRAVGRRLRGRRHRLLFRRARCAAVRRGGHRQRLVRRRRRRARPARSAALLAAYAENRPFSDAERAAWPAMLRAAALRFWLSRLEDFHLPRAGEMVLVKDPDEYRRILRQRARADRLPALPA
jgi:homoserine kinase type II